MLTVDFDRLGLRPGERVLDLGCGGGRHAFECLRRGAAVVALDSDAVELKAVTALMAAMQEAAEVAAGGTGDAVRGDGRALPFPSGCFDRLICAEMLEHVPDDRAVCDELARVLRPRGVLAVTVPRYWPELVNWGLSREYHETPGGHVRIYRRSQLRRLFESAGLEIDSSHHAHALHSPYWWLRCLVGVHNEKPWPVRAYHWLLVYDIRAHPPLMRLLERLLNPVLGKSLVLYVRKREP